MASLEEKFAVSVEELATNLCSNSTTFRCHLQQLRNVPKLKKLILISPFFNKLVISEKK